MKDQTLLSSVAIGAVTVIEGIALYLGHDGAMLALAVGAVCGLAGYEIKALKK